jgi:putative hydrolase of the HAD superfamily
MSPPRKMSLARKMIPGLSPGGRHDSGLCRMETNADSTAVTIPARFRAVIFDFDGVIVDTEGAVYECWRDLFQAHGAELPLDLYARCVGSDHGAWDPKAYFEEVTGMRPDWPPLLEEKNRRTRERLEGSGPMAGAAEALAALAGRGLPLAVASSSSHAWVDGWLARLGLAGYFHSTHCRDDVARVKPSPELFLRAARALGLPPADILVVEDSSNGLCAARAAGMAVLAHGLLHDLILNHGYPQRSELAPSRLGNPPPPYTAGAVTPVFETLFQSCQVLFEVFRVIRGVDTVDSGGGPFAEACECLSKHLAVQQAGQSPESVSRFPARLCSQCGQGA